MTALRFCLGLAVAFTWAAPAAWADEIAWPIEPCMAAEIATASPAPAVNDSRSLGEVPFFLGLEPLSAAYVVSLDEANKPIIRCASYESSPYLLYPGTVAVAGLVFATPRLPNKAVQGGRYLVRLYDTLGIGTVRAPPPVPILLPCSAMVLGVEPIEAPKPSHRVQPVYPDGALVEGIEGQVNIVLDIYASGAATPRCISESEPAGWFEQAALEAVGQWRFEPPGGGPGPRYYMVTVKFKIES